MATLADLQQAYFAQYGYTGSVSDMQYQYLSNPPTLDAYGFVRVASPMPTTQSASIANYTHYHRVIEGGTFTKIRMGMSASSGNICVAAYKNTGSGLNIKPGNQIATTGSIACPVTVGLNDIPMGSSVTVSAGDWLTFGADNATATFACINGTGAYSVAIGSFMVEAVYPAPAVANPIAAANNSRMFSMIGVP